MNSRSHIGVLLLFVAFAFCGCSAKVIRSGSTFYRLESGAGSKRDVVSYVNKKRQPMAKEDKVQQKGGHVKLLINDYSSGWIADRLKVTRTVLIQNKDFAGITDFRKTYQKSPAPAFSSDPNYATGTTFRTVERFRLKGKLTAVNITARNRFQVIDMASEDSIANTWEGKLTPGFAATLEVLRWNRAKGTNEVTTKTLDVGVILAIGTQTINEKLTRPKTFISRKALALTGGFIANYGLKDLDLGLYYGWDVALGREATNWVYQWQPNWGFILGFDLVKPKD